MADVTDIEVVSDDITINPASIVLKSNDGTAVGHVKSLTTNDINTLKTTIAQTNTNKENIAANAAQIALNTADISTNTTAIAKNTTNITTIFDRLDDVSNWESTALMHNNIYRGANLLGTGHFASIAAVMAALRAGNFDDIYVGDYIPASYTVDGSTQTTNFRVAGINILKSKYSDIWVTANPHLCLVPSSVLGTSYMNATNTAAGGYVGSYMYTTVLPKYYQALAGESGTPFYGYLLATMERLSKGINAALDSRAYTGWTGATNSRSRYDGQTLTLLSETEVYGHPAWSSSEFDEEMMIVQLPMFRLNPYSITEYYAHWWLRDVASANSFCNVNYTMYCTSSDASVSNIGIRPRFFVA